MAPSGSAYITFKVPTLTYQALDEQAPECLKEFSADANVLAVPPSCLRSCGDRSFVVAGPSLWNSLPRAIRAAEALQGFKQLLKTHIFS